MDSRPPRESQNNGPVTPPRSTAQLQPPTPTVPSNAASQPYTSTHVNRAESTTVMWHEITGKVLGPMPADSFMDAFLPAAKKSTPPPIWEELEKLNNVRGELAMYTPFRKAFQRCCGKTFLVDSHNTSFQNYEDREIKPDITAYQDQFQFTTSGGESKPDIDKVAFMVEAKYVLGDDPFDDNGLDFEDSSAQAKDTLGQICSYATAQMAGQFRTHLFSILFFPEYARILRWDRAGVIVTKKISLLVANQNQRNDLAEFFWRYDNMDRAAQGFDTSVVPITLQDLEQSLRGAGKMLGVDENAPLFRISFPGDNKFFITKPTYMGTASPTGRSTRTFLALHLPTEEIVFLKDTWRVISQGLLPEHEVYAKLKAANVPHVASVLGYQDIDAHKTRTSDFQHESWVTTTGTLRFRTFQHYRLALYEVAYPIELFRYTKELVQAFRDTLKAHRLAHDDARILHRDISAGNVMITKGRRGLLVDWDLSKELSVNVEALSPAERTGTWQFMAARLIMARGPDDPVPIPNREDDLESFRHVLLWTALRRCEHKMTVQVIVNKLRVMFDLSYVGASGLPEGGDMKLSELRSKSTVFEMKLGSNPLQEILLATADVLASRYPLTEQLEDQIRQVEEIWAEVRTKYHNLQEDDIQIRKAFLHEMADLADDAAVGRIGADTVHLWRSRRILASSQWMEAKFQTPLDDSQVDWDTGSANIEREFPRCVKQTKRKREEEINEVDMPVQQRLHLRP